MDPTAGQGYPRARRQGLSFEELDSELMVYDETAHRAHCLNSTAARVWRYCDGNTSVAAMAARLGAEAGAQVDEDIILLALGELGDRNLLERPVQALGRGALSRRQALARLGATAGILLPAITSLVAPTAAAAQSGGSSGTSGGSSGTSGGSSGTSGGSSGTSGGSSGTSGGSSGTSGGSSGTSGGSSGTSGGSSGTSGGSSGTSGGSSGTG